MIAAQVGHIAARAVAAKKDAVLALELSEDMIEKVGGDDGRIDKTEYLTNVLVEAGTVERSDVDSILTRFDELDVCRSGYLDQQDLDEARRRERAAIAKGEKAGPVPAEMGESCCD